VGALAEETRRGRTEERRNMEVNNPEIVASKDKILQNCTPLGRSLEK